MTDKTVPPKRPGETRRDVCMGLRGEQNRHTSAKKNNDTTGPSRYETRG